MFDQNPHTESQLLELISKGSEAAFTRLFENYKDKIYTVALKISKSTTLSEEIVQDVFLKIWLKRADLSQIENFSAYLFVITRNKVYKTLRKIAHDYTAGLISEEHSFTPAKDIALEKEYEILLKNAVNQLPQQQKKVYYLIKDEGLKRSEVAQKLEIGQETVKYHLAQAMKSIRDICTLHLSILPLFVNIFSWFLHNK